MNIKSIVLSIACVLQYPKLNRPDSFQGGDPEFKTSGIIVASDKNRAKLTQLQELLDDHIAQTSAGKKVVSQEFYYENDDGTFEMRFKNKVYTRKSDNSLFSMPIAVVDTNGRPLGTISFDPSDEAEHAAGLPSIGAGTKAIINFEARPFKVGNKVGLSLRMKGIKIKELVEYSAAGSFDDDEDEEFSEGSNRPAQSTNSDADNEFL